MAGLATAQEVRGDADGARFITSNVNGTLAELLRRLDSAGIEIGELVVRKATLEDVIIELTGAGLRE